MYNKKDIKIIIVSFIVLGFIYFSFQTYIFINDTKNNKLNSFTTDGCSYFPDGTFLKPNIWEHCCVEHDKAYYKGGTKEEKIKSDNFLEKCVSEKGYPIIGYLMNLGVKIGGTPYLKTNHRWGYGWSKFVDFKE